MDRYGIKPVPGANQYFDFLINVGRFEGLDTLFEISQSKETVNLSLLNKMISSYVNIEILLEISNIRYHLYYLY
jgi:hypothetical protein